MAAPTESRSPEPTVILGAIRTLGIHAPQEACLSLRLWNSTENSAPPASLWGNESPASCMVLDLIAASEGQPAARQGEVLTVGFPNFQTAILTARRLQWAMQGFGEGENSLAASLALLIHASDEGPAGTMAALFRSLEKAGTGVILLTEKASKPVENLPGFPLQAAAKKGLRELQWRCPDDKSTRSSDEELLAQLIEEIGAQAPAAQQPEPVDNSQRGAEDRFGNQSSHLSESVLGRSRLLLGGLAAAVVVVAVGGFLYLHYGKTAPAPADQTQAVVANSSATTPPAQDAPVSATHAAHPAAAQQNEAPAGNKAQKNLPKPEVKPAQPPAPAQEHERLKPAEPPAAKVVSAGRCDLDPSQFNGQIDQAWKNLGRGKYNDAKREFGAVLACDPGNARAKEGLERAKMAAAEADGSQ